ncbi:MAG TPA: Maf family nucleotide pyrophosphatase [Chloroflexota bacterium]|nr:Maf family nucleotide pyrophosphatase [Chloroflexota bacterium]
MTHTQAPGDRTSHPSPGAFSLLLASGSPRRRELIARLGLPYRIEAADVDEAPAPGEGARDLALRLARAKARAVAADRPGAVVVAADTVVSLGRVVYGKPTDPADARRMLRELAGRAHRVTTGVAVARCGRLWSAALASRVWLHAWDEATIAAYVASGDPLDKAGAYAIQNERFRPVARLEGCRCNVVGFPTALVAALLAQAGVTTPVTVGEACRYGRYAPDRCLPAALRS